MSDSWEIPPAEVRGRGRPLADFLSWMLMAPIVSEQARECIQELVGDDVEFLPFHRLKGRRFFVLNVLRCEAYLDHAKSSFEYAHERFVFKEPLPSVLPLIFKCPDRWGDIFVTAPFGEMIVENKLTGAALADPQEDTMKLILAGEGLNRYPGVIP
jgi:hypothetical protein